MRISKSKARRLRGEMDRRMKDQGNIISVDRGIYYIYMKNKTCAAKIYIHKNLVVIVGRIGFIPEGELPIPESAEQLVNYAMTRYRLEQ